MSEQDHRDAALAQQSILAELDGKIVGFAVFSDEADTLHLEEMSVSTTVQKRGVGSALLQSVINEAEAHDKSAVTLTTFIDVPFNAGFYARFGFKHLPENLTSPHLRALLSAEASRGLPAARRCAMQLDLPAQSRPTKTVS